MEPRSLPLIATILALLLAGNAAPVTPLPLSSKLVHRFSPEARLLRASPKPEFPEKKSIEYYAILFSTDIRKQRMKLRKSQRSQAQLVFPSEGSQTMSYGNDFGWLHYTWIDIGTPNVSFLVALDVGSDLLWVPCDCVQCAPLSASFYSALDRDLNEFSPSGSSTSKHLSCGHQLCELGSDCKSPKQPCPYVINYYTENTSTSGLLVEDILHLSAWGNDTTSSSIRAPVVIGCGMKQSGGYLDGVAPDGLLGLGLGDISVPSLLAKSGFISNSFSLCFNEDDSGRIFFGDRGPVNQYSTSFLPSTSSGNYDTYIIGVEAFCISNSCIKKTNFKAIVDSGTSFTFVPQEVYEIVSEEFDKRVNASRASYEGYPWKYCYKSSNSEALPKIPSVTLVFPANNSFVVHNPVFPIYGTEGLRGFCLAIQPGEEDIGIIGQNFMTGYRVVFDRESLKLGWSKSNCQDLTDAKDMELTPSPGAKPTNPLPSNEQQRPPGDRAVAPAVAGRAPARPSGAALPLLRWRSSLLTALLPLLGGVLVLSGY